MTVGNGAEKAFVELHAAQLKGAGVPLALQRKLATMLVGEDATPASELEQRETGEVFQLVDLRDIGGKELSLRLSARRKVAKESEIFLLEHAWTPGLLGEQARGQLEQIEALRETLWELLQVEKLLSEEERGQVEEYRQACNLRKVVAHVTHEQAVSCLRESSGDLVSATMMASTGEIPGLSSDQPLAFQSKRGKSAFPEGMALCSDYCWQQDAETVQVFVALPLEAGESAVKEKVRSTLTNDTWSLSYDGQPVLEGKLTARVDMDSLWQFHNDRTLLMHLEKSEEAQQWSAVLEEEERVADVSQCSVEFYSCAEEIGSVGDVESNAAKVSSSTFVTEKDLAEFVMRRLEGDCALGQYYVVATREGMSALWFLHSELGCGVELLPYLDPGSEAPSGGPAANCACKVFINQSTGLAMTIFWPTVDLDEGDFVSCHRISRSWQQEHSHFERN